MNDSRDSSDLMEALRIKFQVNLGQKQTKTGYVFVFCSRSFTCITMSIFLAFRILLAKAVSCLFMPLQSKVARK